MKKQAYSDDMQHKTSSFQHHNPGYRKFHSDSFQRETGYFHTLDLRIDNRVQTFSRTEKRRTLMLQRFKRIELHWLKSLSTPLERAILRYIFESLRCFCIFSSHQVVHMVKRVIVKVFGAQLRSPFNVSHIQTAVYK